ncbi:MAG: outer membrane protein assembly factor BamA [Flavobacteriales bacterium]|nr:outer membrane protein assembly factor BamA [Flavobacteriales bacterium]
MKRLLPLLIMLLVCASGTIWSQPTKLGSSFDYLVPREYTIAGISVTGAKFTDVQAIKLLSGLQVGDEITVPGEDISDAIKKLWKQKLFADVGIYAAEIRGNEIYLIIHVQEMPRMSRFSFNGIRKTEADNIRDEIHLISGVIVNENVKNMAVNGIEKYFIEKGFWNVKVEVKEIPDEGAENSVWLAFDIEKGKRVRIKHLDFVGADEVAVWKLRRAMKNTKRKRIWGIFKSSKYIEKEFESDKLAIISKYNELGYRNARILADTITRVDRKNIDLRIYLEEGNQFYFRNIDFVGNTKYSSERLDSILNIQSGDIYDLTLLEARLYMNPNGLDITSLYQDDGYLNFQAYPIETLVENDSIDIEIRMSEGKKFRIGKVTVVGNTKTNDHVIRREIRTKPGDLFRRNDVIRTQRELSQLGYFDPQKFQINPTQNVEKGTVDIEYVVEEKPSDQVELSGGWGAGRVVGSLGVSFNNFSLRNILNREAWTPLPAGDGQRLSLRAQSNGLYFQSYSASFTEPWLGGKKPNSLSIAVWHSIQSNGERRKVNGELNPDRRSLNITGASVGLGKRLAVPDDWFQIYAGLSYQHFNLNRFGSFFSFDDGFSNNLALTLTLSRNSISEPIYPSWGSDISLTGKFTPPYTAIGKMFGNDPDYTSMTDQQRFDWVEYYKVKFTAKWYTTLFSHKVGDDGNQHNLVLATSAGFGFLGAYDTQLGLSPFERFYLGGVYLSGYVLDGREIVNLRGYDELSLTYPSRAVGSPLISKYSAELRYPLSTNPNAYIYMLGFLEAGKTWSKFTDYNPLNVYRSGGVGLRIFLPMFGLLGLDYGWRFDDVPENPAMERGQFHFSIGMNIGEL